MNWPYRILAPSLHDTADAAIGWFSQNWGLKKSSIEVEAEINSDINFRPTFVARATDFHILCIEVSENIYTNTLDSVVLDCREKGLPVQLFVAVPKDVSDSQYSVKLKAAKRAGVGILEVNQSSGTIVQQALSLSLAGVRPIQLPEFPARYRQSLQHAHQTFRDGEPAKACSLVYDELEHGCRTFAQKSSAKRLWTKPAGLNLTTAPWANIMTGIDSTLVRTNPAVRDVSRALVARIVGVTTHRNESGHKPRNLKELIKRDQALRTRFEGAVDLLKEFLEATKAFRI